MEHGDLVEDGWLPTIDLDGKPQTVSLLQALTGAHTIRRLDLPAPTMVPAALRQALLPVLFDALGLPESPGAWRRRFTQHGFSAKERETLATYLGSRYGDRFRLFSDQPFAQVADLAAPSGDIKSVSLLIPSVPSGSNIPLFRPISDADHLDLPPAQAALWLLHAQCWDTAGIKTGALGDPQTKRGITTGNPTGPLGSLGVIIPTGATLYETLLLNTPVLPGGLSPNDRPQWAWDERPDLPTLQSPASSQWSQRDTTGLLDLLTFQSRRIRLIPVPTPQGPRVRHVVLCAGDRLQAPPHDDPHTAWRHTAKPKAGEPALRPRRHPPGRTAWQGLSALLALNLPPENQDGTQTSSLLRQVGELQAGHHIPPGLTLNVETSGIEYGNKNVVVEDAFGDSLPLPVAALLADHTPLRTAVLECVDQTDRVARALDNLYFDLRRAAGGTPLPRDKGERPSARLLHTIESTVRRLLNGLRTIGYDHTTLEQAQHAWETTLRHAALREADALLAAAPPRAVVGHTEKIHDKEITYRSGSAIARFRTQLNGILTRTAATPPHNQEPEGGAE